MSSPLHDTVRWFTFEPGNQDEEERRAEIDLRIDAWWIAFTSKRDSIEALFARREEWDLAAWMQSNLQVIHPELMWEFGPGRESGHRLVITPEINTHLRPLVARILDKAPTMEGWQFFGYRLTEMVDHLAPTIEARTGSSWLGKRVEFTPGSSNRVDVTFQFPKKILKRNPDLARSQAFVACETLLGEQVLDEWLGDIDVVAKLRPGAPIDRLSAEFETTRDAIRSEALPPAPAHLLPEESDWTLYGLEPRHAADYPRQIDMFVGKSMVPDMWITAHSDMPFSSCRFSRFGELFCFLKTDGSEGLDESVFVDKSDIEDALDNALRSRGLGCFIGGGTGLRYSYVDLALADLDAAVPIIRSILREGRLPRRSWIQFFDSAWQTEWIGIWDDSPPPPMVEQADA